MNKYGTDGQELATAVNVAARCNARNWHTLSLSFNVVHILFWPSSIMCQMSAKMPVACLKFISLENFTKDRKIKRRKKFEIIVHGCMVFSPTISPN